MTQQTFAGVEAAYGKDVIHKFFPWIGSEIVLFSLNIIRLVRHCKEQNFLLRQKKESRVNAVCVKTRLIRNACGYIRLIP